MMPETVRHNHDSSSDEINNVIDFRRAQRLARYDESLNPDELDDSDLIDAFLAQTAHPANRGSSSRLAEVIYRAIGDRPKGEMTDAELAWRTRMLKIVVDIESLDDEQIDELLKDDIMKMIYQALEHTSEKAEELREERRALLALRGLRAAGVNRPETLAERNERRWEALVQSLGGTALR